MINDEQLARQYMELAVETMKKSIPEKRKDQKPTPAVGAVIVLPNGTVETAYRGELRQGDHAEYTLLDRKLRSSVLTGSTIFATLEPCACGARQPPKMSCAERIVNARVDEVYIGILDPDPTVASKGMKYLEECGISVKMFDRDLQSIINTDNKDFLQAANERAQIAVKPNKDIVINILEQTFLKKTINDLSDEAKRYFCDRARIYPEEFERFLTDAGMIEETDSIHPKGIALLLFGENPRDFFPQAGIKLRCLFANGEEDFTDIDCPLVLAIDKFEKWFNSVIGKTINRDSSQRSNDFFFPFQPIREAFINSIMHRDYSIVGAKVSVFITPESILVQSPGEPVFPLTITQLSSYRAPSLARNPKIAYVLNRMGFAEEVGLGMSTFKEMPSRYALPQPDIYLENNCIFLRFARSIFDYMKSDVALPPELSEEEILGYEYIKEIGKIRKSEYARHFGFDEKKAQRHLKSLTESGLIKMSDGISPQSRYLTYEATASRT